MNPRAAWRAAVRAVESRDGCLAVRGWHLIGPGPARYGWAFVYPSGARRWIGRTILDGLRRSGWPDGVGRVSIALPVRP